MHLPGVTLVERELPFEEAAPNAGVQHLEAPETHWTDSHGVASGATDENKSALLFQPEDDSIHLGPWSLVKRGHHATCDPVQWVASANQKAMGERCTKEHVIAIVGAPCAAKASPQKWGVHRQSCHASAEIHIQKVHLQNPIHAASRGHSRETEHRGAANKMRSTQLDSFADVADTQHEAGSRHNSAVTRQTLPV